MKPFLAKVLQTLRLQHCWIENQIIEIRVLTREFTGKVGILFQITSKTESVKVKYSGEETTLDRKDKFNQNANVLHLRKNAKDSE